MTYRKCKELYCYSPLSGLLTRRIKRGNHDIGALVGAGDKDGYIITSYKKRMYKVHRLIWLYQTGNFPTSSIDHKNRVKDDNRWENLREANRSEQQHNKPLSKNNTSGVKGVYFFNNRWYARISIDNVNNHLGCFVEFSDAVNARKNAEVLYGFHENHGKDL